MQADLRVHDYLLGSRHSVGNEVGVERDVALDQRQRNRPGLEVTGRAVGRWFSEPSRCNRVRRRGGRTTGSFILIDEATGVTVGAGMINSGN